MLGATGLLAVAGTAGAAPPTQEASPLRMSEVEDVRVMHEFSRCVVERSTEEARRVLALDFRTGRYRTALELLAGDHPRCVPRGHRLGFSGMLLAGGMAEHLFLSDHGAADAAQLLAQRPADPAPRNASESLSYCTVRRSAGAARAVLATPPASPEEAAALDALRPALGACLTEPDEARMNRPGLRSLIALAFYHLTGGRASDAP